MIIKQIKNSISTEMKNTYRLKASNSFSNSSSSPLSKSMSFGIKTSSISSKHDKNNKLVTNLQKIS